METMISPARERGIRALREGDFEAAVDLLTHAAQEDRHDAEVQACLGIASSQKGLHEVATQALQTAVRLRPQEARYQYNLGVAYEMAGDAPAAVQACRRALQVDPSYSQAREKLQELTARLAEARPYPTWEAGTSAGTAPAPWLDPAYASPYENRAGPLSIPNIRPAMGAGEAFGRRFAALLIDAIVLYCLGLIAGMSIGFVVGFASGLAGGGRISPLAQLLSSLACLVASFIVGLGYSGFMLSACGQTVGKMALGIRVVGPDGRNPSFWRAVLRDGIGQLISSIVFCLGYVWMLWDPEQQTWHDKIAGTRVTRA